MTLRLLAPLLLACISCTLDGGKKVSVEELKFSTTDDSEIFFKNLRQSAYLREEVGQMVVFRNKNYAELDSCNLQVSLVWNWLNDRAYILIDTPAGPEDTLSFLPIRSGKPWFFTESQNASEQTRAAAQLYNALIDRDTVVLSAQGFEEMLFMGTKEREAFRVTMSDYFRLTNNF